MSSVMRAAGKIPPSTVFSRFYRISRPPRSLSKVISHGRYVSSSPPSPHTSHPLLSPFAPPPVTLTSSIEAYALEAASRPYKNRSTTELINSLVVFHMCGVPGVVEAGPAILEAAEKMGLAGGETLKEVLPTMEHFKQASIGSILDLALEADVDDANESNTTPEQNTQKVAAMFNESIDLASQQTGSFVALKITALLPPLILQRWSTSLNKLRQAFNEADTNHDGKIGWTEFRTLSKTFPALSDEATCRAIFSQCDTNNDGTIDWIDVSDTFTIVNPTIASTL
ncbi:hypothetical protein HK104_009709, partial [Borealophlyctis nickersoniae]